MLVLLVSYAVAFAAEIPAHETVLAVSAIEKEIRIAASFTIDEVSASVAIFAHETFIEKFGFFDCVAVATVFISDCVICYVIAVFEVAGVVAHVCVFVVAGVVRVFAVFRVEIVKGDVGDFVTEFEKLVEEWP